MRSKILILVLITISFLVVTPVLAGWVEDIIGGPLIPEGCTKDRTSDSTSQVEECGLKQMLQVVINFSKILLALTGSAALLMFIYGGALFIVAAGKQEMIQKGKAAMSAAAIGIVIMLGAYLIVNFIILALTNGEVGGQATIFEGINPFNIPN